jgi:hypothetical protein
VTKAQFSKVGDPRYFWVERVSARDEEISLTFVWEWVTMDRWTR